MSSSGSCYITKIINDVAMQHLYHKKVCLKLFVSCDGEYGKTSLGDLVDFFRNKPVNSKTDWYWVKLVQVSHAI